MTTEGQQEKGAQKKRLNELFMKESQVESEIKRLREINPSDEMLLLHKYNEIKDTAQVFLGTIGNIEGVTVRDLHERFHLPIKE